MICMICIICLIGGYKPFELQETNIELIGGQTASSQLFPFKLGSNNIVLTPASASNQTCLVAGADRVESAQCNSQKDQVFELVEIV